MRKIAVAADSFGVLRLFLNGRPLFQYGLLDQGWWPDGLYTAPTDEALRYDLEATQRMGFNMARKHVKVEPARWYWHADRLGLLVWQDMPSADNETVASREQFSVELRRMVDALRNHPSIVMWVPFNEGWGQHDTERTTTWLAAYDPTRLVNSATGWTDKGVGDVVDEHAYPGPAIPERRRPARARSRGVRWARPPARGAYLGAPGQLGLPDVRGHRRARHGLPGPPDAAPLPGERGARGRGLHADHRRGGRGQRHDDLRPRGGEAATRGAGGGREAVWTRTDRQGAGAHLPG